MDISKIIASVNSIPCIEQNLVFGAVGGITVIIHEVYCALPQIQGKLFEERSAYRFHLGWLRVALLILIKLVFAAAGAAIVAGFLIQPSTILGAILSGLTWVKIVQEKLVVREIDE